MSTTVKQTMLPLTHIENCFCNTLGVILKRHSSYAFICNFYALRAIFGGKILHAQVIINRSSDLKLVYIGLARKASENRHNISTTKIFLEPRSRSTECSL